MDVFTFKASTPRNRQTNKGAEKGVSLEVVLRVQERRMLEGNEIFA